MLFKRVRQFWESQATNSGFMKYFKNTSWLLIERIFRLTFSFFIGVWVVRYLGPEEFGILSYTQSFVSLFAVIASLGLDEIVIRELVKNPAKRDLLLGTAFGLKLIGVGIMLLMLGLGIFISGNDFYTNILILILASSVVFQSFNVIDLYFQSKVLSKYIVYIHFISITISAVLKVYFILSGMPLIAFVILVSIDAFIVSLGFIYMYYKQQLTLWNWSFSLTYFKSLLRDSWPIILSGMLLIIQARIDQIMIKDFLGYKEVGYYNAALRLVEAIAFFPVILKSSLFPAIQNVKDQPEYYSTRMLNLYRLNFFLFLIVAIPISFFAEITIETLYGIDYLPSVILLQIMVLRLFFTNMGSARGIYILTDNLFKFSLLTMSIGTLTNVLLNLLWIPIYKSLGAIMATMISFFITIFLIDILYSKTRKNSYLMINGILSFYKIKLK
jgi:O-antigen/teichoic acid export membrane protein